MESRRRLSLVDQTGQCFCLLGGNDDELGHLLREGTGSVGESKFERKRTVWHNANVSTMNLYKRAEKKLCNKDIYRQSRITIREPLRERDIIWLLATRFNFRFA